MNAPPRFPPIRRLAPLLLLPFLCSAPRAGAAAEPKAVRGLVVLVHFADSDASPVRALVERRFNVQLADYVREMSYGTVALSVDVTPSWYGMPRQVAYYRISPHNLQVDRSRVRALIDDALAGVGPDVDFARYSFVAIVMAAGLGDYGMVGLCGYPGMLGWQRDDALRTRDGRTVRGGVAIFTYQAHLGTLFHDIAHVLGGVRDGKRLVPCLYDHDLQARRGPLRETFERSIVNMGFWDPMSCHYWRRDAPPPGISSWTMLRLGWLDDSRVRTVRDGEEAEVLLGPLRDASARTTAIRIPLSATRYYLVENRQPTGYDRNLPGSGVLVLSADDTVAECRHGEAPVKLVDARPSVPRLEGAAFDAAERNVFRDPVHHLTIRVVEQVGDAFRVHVGRKPE